MTTDLCSCCNLLEANPPGPWCDECAEHMAQDYCFLHDSLGCPVYDAWARCEPYPWELAA